MAVAPRVTPGRLEICVRVATGAEMPRSADAWIDPGKPS
jgi:molybdopterin biosynthesis enzyme